MSGATPLAIPTADALERDIAALDRAIEEAQKRTGGGAWPLAREAKRRLEAVVAEKSQDGTGRLLPWTRPAWAVGHQFADRQSAQAAARRALVELDQALARGGFQAFGSVSLVLVAAFGVERPEGLNWAPDVVLLTAERAAVEGEMRRLYGPRDPAPEDMLPMAATA